MNNSEVEKSSSGRWIRPQKLYKNINRCIELGAQSSLDALNEVCLEQHTGPDGKNILWPNVDITVIVDL